MSHSHHVMAETARDVEATVIGFFVALDRSDYARMLDLVTEDMEWVRPSGTVHGRGAVRQVLEARPRSRVTRHLVSNIVVAAGGTGMVTARCDVLILEKGFDGEPSLPAAIRAPSMMLSIEDHLVQEAEGSPWRIARKLATSVFNFQA